jgi:hypothetical protein
MMKVVIVILILIIIIFVLDNECLIMVIVVVYMLYAVYFEDKSVSNVDLSSSSFVFISSAAS